MELNHNLYSFKFTDRRKLQNLMTVNVKYDPIFTLRVSDQKKKRKKKDSLNAIIES